MQLITIITLSLLPVVKFNYLALLFQGLCYYQKAIFCNSISYTQVRPTEGCHLSSVVMLLPLSSAHLLNALINISFRFSHGTLPFGRFSASMEYISPKSAHFLETFDPFFFCLLQQFRHFYLLHLL